MEPIVRSALEKVLTQIMSSLGRKMPPFVDDMKPIDDLDRFNSELWPAAKGMLQKELNILIPPGTNPFREPGTKRPYTVKEIVTNLAGSLTAWQMPLPS